MYAGMVKLADTQDLGSCAAMRVGSSPTTRTTSSRTTYRSRRRFFTPSLIHSVAPPLQIEPAALGFDLVFPAGTRRTSAGLRTTYRSRRRERRRSFRPSKKAAAEAAALSYAVVSAHRPPGRGLAGGAAAEAGAAPAVAGWRYSSWRRCGSGRDCCAPPPRRRQPKPPHP